ncbi:MAG: hypothetical protein ACFN4K_07715 [Pauljensenia sp.]
MAQGHILTRSFEFETRQYKFGPLDVVDGVPRSALTIGVPLVVAWCALLWLIFGPPGRLSILIYITLPVALVVKGFEDDPRRERRKRITTWMHWLRYAFVGHRPVIAGRRSTNPREALSLATRFQLDRIRHYVGDGADTAVWATRSDADAHRDGEAGAGIDLTQKVILIGFDAMTDLRTATQQKHKRRRKKRV